ncbi:unnamed protein product [Closterium sp. NIES-64]|nr:unnamed protein product [Closterium sp. NIES-64]
MERTYEGMTPTVMAYSWTTIEDKILFVTEVMGRSIAEIVVWPALLTRSVEKRLRPRYEMLRRLPREQQLSLGSMFGCTDEVFKKRYGRKIAMLAEREGAEVGQEGGGEEDGGEEGGREEDGGEKGREKGGLGEGEGDIEGGTTGADVEEERGR